MKKGNWKNYENELARKHPEEKLTAKEEVPIKLGIVTGDTVMII